MRNLKRFYLIIIFLVVVSIFVLNGYSSSGSGVDGHTLFFVEDSEGVTDQIKKNFSIKTSIIKNVDEITSTNRHIDLELDLFDLKTQRQME